MTAIAIRMPPSMQIYREHLNEFFNGMIRKLYLNSHKQTPIVSDTDTMIELLLQEVYEFKEQLSINKFDVNSLVELFDTANYAFLMFVALRNDGVNSPRELLIKEFFEIDVIKGKIYCKKTRAGSQYKIKEEIKGTKRKGYIDIKLQSKSHNFISMTIPRSHLIWWKAKGYWPVGIIDHKNRIRNDDRISNLRDVSFHENNLNHELKRKYPPYVTPYLPTGRSHLLHYGKFVYQRHYNGINIRCAYYDTPELAAIQGEKDWKNKIKKLEKEKSGGR